MRKEWKIPCLFRGSYPLRKALKKAQYLRLREKDLRPAVVPCKYYRRGFRDFGATTATLERKSVCLCQPLQHPCFARIAFLKHGHTPKGVIFDLDSLLDA